MTITGGTALPREEIDRMMREAEQFADEDKKRRVEAEARNQADNLVYQTEKVLAEHGSKVPEAERAEVQAALDALKEALKGTDVSDITAKQSALEQASQKIGQAVYAAMQQEQAAAAGGSGGASEPGPAASGADDVVDAEVVDEGEGS